MNIFIPAIVQKINNYPCCILLASLGFIGVCVCVHTMLIALRHSAVLVLNIELAETLDTDGHQLQSWIHQCVQKGWAFRQIIPEWQLGECLKFGWNWSHGLPIASGALHPLNLTESMRGKEREREGEQKGPKWGVFNTKDGLLRGEDCQKAWECAPDVEIQLQGKGIYSSQLSEWGLARHLLYICYYYYFYYYPPHLHADCPQGKSVRYVPYHIILDIHFTAPWLNFLERANNTYYL